MAYGISVSQPRIAPSASAVEVQSSTCWTTRDVPRLLSFKKLFFTGGSYFFVISFLWSFVNELMHRYFKITVLMFNTENTTHINKRTLRFSLIFKSIKGSRDPEV